MNEWTQHFNITIHFRNITARTHHNNSRLHYIISYLYHIKKIARLRNFPQKNTMNICKPAIVGHCSALCYGLYKNSKFLETRVRSNSHSNDAKTKTITRWKENEICKLPRSRPQSTLLILSIYFASGWRPFILLNHGLV